MDADAANIYATIQAGALPASAPPGTRYGWAVHWRYLHSSRYARAILDDSGTWAFESGYSNDEVFPIKAVDITGDTSPSRGLIRMAIPRSFLDYTDGEMMRQIGAFSQLIQQGLAVDIDRAPNDSSHVQPTGGDYVVGVC
jgi:hypothetical protein